VLNKSSAEIHQLNLVGDITPHAWFTHPQLKTTGLHPKTYTLAINVLADIIYWYRPVEEFDAEGVELRGLRNKFSGHKLQRSYGQIARKFGISAKQARDAVSFLRARHLITTEVVKRLALKNGDVLGNVLFIEPVAAMIREITYPAHITAAADYAFSDIEFSANFPGAETGPITPPSDTQVIPYPPQVIPHTLQVRPSDVQVIASNVEVIASDVQVHSSIPESQSNTEITTEITPETSSEISPDIKTPPAIVAEADDSGGGATANAEEETEIAGAEEADKDVSPETGEATVPRPNLTIVAPVMPAATPITAAAPVTDETTFGDDDEDAPGGEPEQFRLIAEAPVRYEHTEEYQSDYRQLDVIINEYIPGAYPYNNMAAQGKAKKRLLTKRNDGRSKTLGMTHAHRQWTIGQMEECLVYCLNTFTVKKADWQTVCSEIAQYFAQKRAGIIGGNNYAGNFAAPGPGRIAVKRGHTDTTEPVTADNWTTKYQPEFKHRVC